MDINRAKEVLSALAEGIDPTTGEVLPENNVCNKGEVVRAFYAILQAFNQKDRKNAPENAGKCWTDEEENHLKELYNIGFSKKEIANELRRTTGSISSRLVRLGLIDD